MFHLLLILDNQVTLGLCRTLFLKSSRDVYDFACCVFSPWFIIIQSEHLHKPGPGGEVWPKTCSGTSKWSVSSSRRGKILMKYSIRISLWLSIRQHQITSNFILFIAFECKVISSASPFINLKRPRWRHLTPRTVRAFSVAEILSRLLGKFSV